MSLISRLPTYYRNNAAFFKIAELLQGSTCRYSGLFVMRGDSTHLLLKDGSIHVPLDWQAFSLMRATSGLIIASGQIVRQQPDVFKVRETYHNPHIDQLYSTFLGKQRQKLYFFTRQFTPHQLADSINEKLYDLVTLPGFNSVHHALSLLKDQQQNLPITVQFGLDLLHQYFLGVREGGENIIDTILISKFTGNVDSKLVGPQLKERIGDFYKEVWRSDSFPCNLSNGQQGHLTLEVHKLK